MNKDEKDCRSFFELQGFNESGTGGGCTAWIRSDGDNGDETLVTDGDLAAPLSLASACVVSRYRNGEYVSSTEYASVSDLIKQVESNKANRPEGARI